MRRPSTHLGTVRAPQKRRRRRAAAARVDSATSGQYDQSSRPRSPCESSAGLRGRRRERSARRPPPAAGSERCVTSDRSPRRHYSPTIAARSPASADSRWRILATPGPSIGRGRLRTAFTVTTEIADAVDRLSVRGPVACRSSPRLEAHNAPARVSRLRRQRFVVVVFEPLVAMVVVVTAAQTWSPSSAERQEALPADPPGLPVVVMQSAIAGLQALRHWRATRPCPRRQAHMPSGTMPNNTPMIAPPPSPHRRALWVFCS